ncbi:MAG: hypothetical protein DHS20C17_13250 [Cyclobacteriaceae bacterium]|nr:MAG: hypothetical protein DHS20C17_13250 [Cyclobacteriaceae bacterium]
MHNSYFLLRELSNILNKLLTGSILHSCYSQDKNELVMQFHHGEDEHFIHAMLRNDFSMIRVPAQLSRARRNSADLFSEIAGTKVTRVFCIPYERCLCLVLSDDYTVLFKMFGNQSNIIVCKDDTAISLFKQKLRDDLELSVSSLTRQVFIGEDQLNAVNGDFTKMLPVLGGVVKKEIEAKGYHMLNNHDKWKLVEQTLKLLNNPEFFILNKNGLPILTMFKSKDPLFRSKDAKEALNEFFRRFISTRAISKLKKDTLRVLKKQQRNAENLISKNSKRLDQLKHETSYRERADLIMANLHVIKPGSSLIHLPRFETGEPIAVKLKTSLSPQKNAEQYYRKAKNQSKEIEILNTNIKSVLIRAKTVDEQISYIEKCQDLKQLKKYLKDHHLGVAPGSNDKRQLFKEFYYQGFTILIGRNAANNDLLTQKYAYKEDLWLHARDVKGSHVIIKKIPGREFPASVIEKAAQLAAYYSKRRNDSLCPVIYTEKKFVRKPKGSAPGLVVLEREKVLLVKPDGQITPQ